MKTKISPVVFALTFFISLLAVILANDKPLRPAREQGDAPRTSGAMAALTFWTRARAYPNVDISPDKQFRAFVADQIARKSVPRSLSATPPWQTIGPHNIGGRMNSIIVNPQNRNTLYAGSASGGLWRSYNRGIGPDAWDQVSTGFPVLGVMAIAMNPVDTNTIYIGTGEVYGYQQSIGGTVIRTTRGSYGIGILKTTNGGTTWSKSLDWSANQERGIQVLRINPLNPTTIWAGTSDGIYRSTDAGATWNLLLNVLMGEDIIIKSGDTNSVMVSCGNLGSPGSGIYMTSDNGGNWVPSTGTLPLFNGKTLLASYPHSPNTVYASVADAEVGLGIWKTENFGLTWFQIYGDGLGETDIPSYQGWFSHYVAVNPLDSTLVYAGGGPDFWKSYDGGESFIQTAYWWRWYLGETQPGGPEGPFDYAHADHHAFAFDPTTPSIMYLATDGGVFCSEDDGETFQGRNGGLQTTQFYNGFSSSPLDSNFSAGGFQDNASALYRGTLAWFRTTSGDGNWTAIHPLNDNIVFVSTQYNRLYRSTNRGASFTTVFSAGQPAATAFASPYLISPNQPSIMYSGRDVVYKSTNGGTAWFATNGGATLDGNPSLSMGISSTNPDTVYAGTAPIYSQARIWRTTNGGGSWVNITGSLPNRYPMDIAVDPTDSRRAFVVFGGFGSGHVYTTPDAGATWDDITGSLPDIPTSSVIVDPLFPQNIYVGNDLGVYVSSNSGTTWWPFNDGLPDAIIAMDLSISIQNRMLRVATHGNGAYQRNLVNTPFIALSSPAGGEVWTAGSTRQINWSSFFVSSIRIDYSTDNGLNWSVVDASLPASPPAYLWTIPETPTNEALVRITSLEDAGLTSQSPSVFAIVLPSVTFEVNERWNLVSIPVDPPDKRSTALFPTAVGGPYDYDGGYGLADSLHPGSGYWVKFPSPQSVMIAGWPIAELPVVVSEGWNLVGSISSPVPVSDVTSIPPGIIVSPFYRFERGYQSADSINAGSAYWVKVSQDGQIRFQAP